MSERRNSDIKRVKDFPKVTQKAGDRTELNGKFSTQFVPHVPTSIIHFINIVPIDNRVPPPLN